jgi:hypothetical protein
LVGHACARRLKTMVHEQVALRVLGTHGCTGLMWLYSSGHTETRTIRRL